MHERIFTIETLEQIETTIENLLISTQHIEQTDELTSSPDGMLRLNGICMSFIIIGEEIKRIDRYTKKQFLSNYSSIPWNDVMSMRDRIAHGYFEIDIDVVFDTLKNDMPQLLTVIKQMKADINSETK